MKRFRMERRGDDAELFIYDQIGEDFFGGVSSKSLYEDLKAVGQVKNLTVRINSGGGDVFEGFAMYNHIRNADAQSVTVKIDALAASAASMIAMAGNDIEIAGNAYIMIHNPWGFAMGDYRTMDEQASLLRQITDTSANIYADKTGLTVDAIKELMDAETWMDAVESVDHGFATRAVDELKVAANLDMTRFPNAPKKLRRAADPNIIPAKLASMRRRLDSVKARD